MDETVMNSWFQGLWKTYAEKKQRELGFNRSLTLRPEWCFLVCRPERGGGGGICYRSFKSVYFLNYVHQYDFHFTARYIEALAVHMPTPQV